MRELAWRDTPLASLPLPHATLEVTVGLGSGLFRRPGAPPGQVWAVGDRGPNLKPKMAVKRYGLAWAEAIRDLDGAKIMPLPAFVPSLYELRVEGEAVRLVRSLPLRAPDGTGFSGLALPGGLEAQTEPVFDLDGGRLGADLLGVDSEAVVALAGGGFWVAEEYGPSLLRVGPDGAVTARWVPAGLETVWAHPSVPVLGLLPAAAARRRLNRGFEALAISADERRLYAMMQSPLEGGETAVRIWTLEADTGALLGEHLYPFDRPKSFRRDAERGDVDADDLKLCEAICLGPGRLLILERISHTGKLYAVTLGPERILTKQLVFSTDDHPGVVEDLEGVALLSDRELLLVNDNDFGTEGAATRFFTLRFEAPL